MRMTSNVVRHVVSVLAATLLGAACSKGPEPSPAPMGAPSPPPTAAPTPAPTPTPASEIKPSPYPPGERLISGIVTLDKSEVCLQQVGKFDDAYVAKDPDKHFLLDVSCPSRGFGVRDETRTRAMFDEPGIAANGAYVKAASDLAPLPGTRERMLTDILADHVPPVCIQQVGRYDEKDLAGGMDAKLDVTCESRGYAKRDDKITRDMFDEPDKPGNGAFVK